MGELDTHMYPIQGKDATQDSDIDEVSLARENKRDWETAGSERSRGQGKYDKSFQAVKI